MEDSYKPDYVNLHLDLVNTLSNLQAAERLLRIAEAYISPSNPDRERPLELDIVTRACLTTGLGLIIPSLSHLINIAETARVPCERRYPQLADTSRIQ